ncbi:universal stress protein [Alteromonas sp. CYL-A6]|uniref:universal stress protein n=1 Tax=Alteromonas nitratireducens TaxID=3390813 RepID=UPI0034A8B6FB
MEGYKTLLVAVDVYADYDVLIERAIQVAGHANACHLLYVAYPQSTIEPYGLYLERDFTDEVRQQAEKSLHEAARRFGIPENQLYVEFGSPADEIHHKSEKLKADLIVIGTHGQSGMRLLLGSTANAVLHGVKTDVLAIKL